MFAGIVEELGIVKRISRRSNVILLEVEGVIVLQGTGLGDSIAVNGACLTLIAKQDNTVGFEVMAETLKNTNLGRLKISEKVNLERSLKIGDRLSGHFVTGHVDCLGVIRNKKVIAGNQGFEIALPRQYLSQIFVKGSIAVDGISLTVAEKKSGTFSVYIIPHTLKNTTLSFKGPSAFVNVEIDILAKKS